MIPVRCISGAKALSHGRHLPACIAPIVVKCFVSTHAIRAQGRRRLVSSGGRARSGIRPLGWDSSFHGEFPPASAVWKDMQD